MGSTHSSTMNNNGNDASASGNGGGGEEAVMAAVADQPAAEEDQQQQDQQLTISAVDDGNQNETANGNNNDDVEEMVVDAEPVEETEGENVPSSASSRYSLRKRSRQPLLSIQDSSNGATVTASTGGRSSRKKQQSYDPNAAGYVNAANLTDRQFEKLLQEYEEKGERQRLQKKQRLERGYADDDYPYEPPAEGCPAFDALPKEAIRLVFELLPSARSVFNLAYQSKYMLSFVEKRMEIVIRATLLEDAHKNIYSTPQRSILSGIVKLVRKRSIHVPSPLRLLKMVNAKYCERGANCLAFDLKKGVASKKDMSSAWNQPFGFATCSTCTQDCSTKLPKIWRYSYRYDHWIRQEQNDGNILFYGWRTLFDPDKGSDLCIGSNGERIGPIIDGKHLQHIANVHPSDTEEQKNLFATMKKQEYGGEGSDKMEAFDMACADLVQIYEEAEKERKERRTAHYEKWREDNKAKNDAATASKRAKVEPILTALQDAIADAPLNEMALDFEWESNPNYPLQFRYHFVKDSLGKLLSAPSSASQKKIKAACANVRRKLEILSTMAQAEGDDDDFFSLDFLTTAHEECSSSLKKKALQKISEYCKAKLTGGMKGVIGGEHWSNHSDANNTNDRFFDLLEGGPEKYVDAVLHILSARKALGDIVSEVLVPTTTNSNSVNHRHLAKAVWKKVEREMEGEGFTQASFYEALSQCKTEFQTMKTNAKDYLDEDAVKGFRNSNAWDSRKNRDAVDQVFDPQDSPINVRSWQSVVIPANVQNLRPYRLLLDRDFENLLRIHRFYSDNLYRWRHSAFGAVSHLHQTVVATNNTTNS